jgi:DNA mismatch endonuclease, patch repair protein
MSSSRPKSHKLTNTAILPKTRLDYWKPKLERNIARDAANRKSLTRQGWRVLVLWECDILKKREQVAERIGAFLALR